MASTMAATRRPKYSNSRARDAGAIMQGIGGLIGGLSEAASRQQQQQLEYQRQRQAELQRQRQEAERLDRQRNLEVQQRQYEMEKQRLALDRQRWKEESDKEGLEVFGWRVPSWLWQGLAVAVICWLVSRLFRGVRCG